MLTPAADERTTYLVSGPMVAGETTVARFLAARFERAVFLEGEFFGRSIITVALLHQQQV